MDFIVDTLEGRLQMALGQKDFEIEVLRQKLSDSKKAEEDLREELRKVRCDLRKDED